MPDGTTKCLTIKGNLKGVKPKPSQAEVESTKWIRFEDVSWLVEKNKIVAWMKHYGIVMTDVEETCDKVFDEVDDSDDDDVPLGTGVWSIKIRMTKQLPQYLPMCGKKIKVYYKGIAKQCTNCYVDGHIKKDCTNSKKEWIEYVTFFIATNSNIPDELFGKWIEKAQEWYENNPEKIILPLENLTTEDEYFTDASNSPATDETLSPNQPTLGEKSKKGQRKTFNEK